jgi:hypothetical protein
MRLLHRLSFAVVLGLSSLAIADDDAVVAPPPSPSPPPVAAQPPPPPPPVAAPKRTTVGADLALVLPLGDYADGSDFAAGGLLRVEYAATPEVSISLRAGYIWHKTTSDSIGIGMVPVLLGGVYKIGNGPFAYGEVGINLIRVSTELMGFSVTDGETYLSVGAGGGYAVGKVSARLGLWLPGRPKDSDGTTTLFGILGSVGFDFNAF